MSRGSDCFDNARYIGSITDGIIHDSDNAIDACRRLTAGDRLSSARYRGVRRLYTLRNVYHNRQ